MPKDTIRITVDLTEEQYQQLGALKADQQEPSKSAVVRRALKLYGFLVRRRLSGYKIYVEKEGERELIPLD